MKRGFKKTYKEIKMICIFFLIVNFTFIAGCYVSYTRLEDENLNILERLSETLTNLSTVLTNPFSMYIDLFKNFYGFIQLTGFLFLATAIVYLVRLYNNRKKYKYDGTEHGSSRWASGGEEYEYEIDKLPILGKHDGFILSRYHTLKLDSKINKNIIVFGGSGTGKSACYVKPNILQKLGSYVITDPKGELYRDTSNYLKNNGWNVKVLNLVDAKFSDCYNPLAHIKDHADVDIIAHTIVMSGEEGKSADPFWDNTAKMLLKACIYYVISVLPEEEQNLSSCLNIVRAGGSDETIFDKLFINELKPEHPGRKEYEGIRVGADKTKQSIAISLVSKLTHFDTPNMQRITTTNNINFEDLGTKKTAIYVISPDSHSTYNYILTIFYAQLLQRLYSQADKNGGSLKEKVYLLLDEFANIGKIPDFNQKLSTSRSRGISMSIIVQSLDQLVDLYKDLHENILANCDTQIFLGSQSIKTCEYFSKSLGNQTIRYDSVSVSRDKNGYSKQGISSSEQKQARELMTIDELKRLDNDSEVIIIRGIPPMLTKKAWYYKYHKERQNADGTKIRNINEMPKIAEAEIKTMDVVRHIEE